jgi:hypothetical protein
LGGLQFFSASNKASFSKQLAVSRRELVCISVSWAKWSTSELPQFTLEPAACRSWHFPTPPPTNQLNCKSEGSGGQEQVCGGHRPGADCGFDGRRGQAGVGAADHLCFCSSLPFLLLPTNHRICLNSAFAFSVFLLLTIRSI